MAAAGAAQCRACVLSCAHVDDAHYDVVGAAPLCRVARGQHFRAVSVSAGPVEISIPIIRIVPDVEKHVVGVLVGAKWFGCVSPQFES